jgi:pseudo-rSAM protein
MENQYFILEPFLFVNIIENNVLFYNSANGEKKIFNSPAIIEFLNRNKNNLYVFQLLPDDLKNSTIKEFISELKSQAMGFVYRGQIAPIQFSPALKLEDVHKIDNLKINDSYNKIHNSYNNIDTLFLYVNHFNKFISPVKQFLYRKTSEIDHNQKNEEINFEHLEKFISSTMISNRLRSINLLGDNVGKYSYIDSFIDFFANNNDISMNVYIDSNYTEQDFYKVEKILHLKLGKMILCISSKCENDKLLKLIDSNFTKKTEVICLIEQEDDIDFFESWLKQYQLSYKFVPIFNSRNLSFFKTHVFIDQNDIDNIFLNQNQVFRNQTLNSNYYGKMVVLSNGDVYSNVYAQPLGNIAKDSLIRLIDNEINSIPNSWFCVKQNLAPCNKCVYNILCPPVSNYEFIINRNNLCSLRI